ncbi:MAG: DUF1566 domain-containing protein [Myxococcales bacterium]|nr:DUF1566 domain-containing protein [Myxococcales bacterium]
MLAAPRPKPAAAPLLALALALACGRAEERPEAAAEPAAKGEAPAPEAPAPEAPASDAAKPGESFAQPTAKPPPPPVGAFLLEKPALFVQRCDADHPCPKLLQAAGEAHCRALNLDPYEGGWRLPDVEEVKRLKGIDALDDLEGFHWTRTPYADDPKQAWIVDPVGGQSTTIPRDRKPFTIRCVYDP